MRVGSATVYVEQVGAPVDVAAQGAAEGEVYPVAPSPQEAFETASEALRECVRMVGDHLEALAGRRPQQVTVEFTVSFEVKGRAALIPVLLTGEATSKGGLTVKAVWRRPGAV